MEALELTAAQCRMARAALKLEVRELAELADVSPNTIVRLERGERLHRRTLRFVKGVLEAEGIVFVEDGASSRAGGYGVRLGGGHRSRYGLLFETINKIPDLRCDPAAAYGALIALIEQYFDIIDSEEREPDSWERLDFNDALNALKRGDVFGAASYIRHAITPPDNQSVEYPLSTEAMASVADLNRYHFRKCLSHLKTNGYRPRFGEVL